MNNRLLTRLACGIAVWGTGFCAAAQQPDIPTLPPTIVTPERPTPAAPADAPPDGFSDVGAYPDLSQQFFGGTGGVVLDGVTRSGLSIFDIPAHGSIIGRQALAEKQPMDMFQALQNEVGVLVQQTARGQASPFIRGLTGQQVLVLIDGIRTNNAI